ncbi:MAG: glycoside hydrolase family 3 protein [Treponema sp.]|jgi:beta-N-acetylhexosaminidase|nr:glycoside hydrolase family 3 protein [Treponema sp.]
MRRNGFRVVNIPRSFFPAGLLLVSALAALGGLAWAEERGSAQGRAAAGSAASGSATRDRAAAIAASLDERLLAAQLIFTGVDGNRSLGGAMKGILRDCPPGGIVLFRYNLNVEKEAVKAFLAECAAFTGAAGIPPFVAVDHEGGSVHRFGQGVSRLPAAAFWRELAEREGEAPALAALEEAAFASGTELRELGITFNLAPVAEVLDGENRAFLGDRSFGEDPLFVTAAAAAFMRGMERAGVSSTLKHFPGNTGTDPHRASPVLGKDGAALAGMTGPFAALVKESRVPAVMVSHALVPALDGEHIASLSSVIMKGWLREGLGFQGLIIADDFSMGALRDSGLGAEDAAVRSLAAGADMIMAWPSTLRRTHAAILAALEDGRLSREAVLASAERVIAEKIRLGLLE